MADHDHRPDGTCDTEEIHSDELPLYNRATLPQSGQLILLVEEPNNDCGGKMSGAYRLPLDRITPGSTFQSNTYSLDPANPGIVVPDDEVVPAYVETFSPFNVMRAQADDSTTKAKFLIIANDQNIDENYIIQSSGYLAFKAVHSYQVGQTYYLSATTPGGVTTTPPADAQPLFYVVDQKTIQIVLEV